MKWGGIYVRSVRKFGSRKRYVDHSQEGAVDCRIDSKAVVRRRVVVIAPTESGMVSIW